MTASMAPSPSAATLPAASALISLQMKCLYEQQAMKRDRHKLKMALLLAQQQQQSILN